MDVRNLSKYKTSKRHANKNRKQTEKHEREYGNASRSLITESAWLPPHRRKNVRPAICNGPNWPQVQRKIRSLLNKITVEKMERVSQLIVHEGLKMLDVCKSFESRVQALSTVATALLEKAVNEVHYSTMYTELAIRLDQALPKISAFGFKRVFLNHCQREFENSLNQLKQTSVVRETRADKPAADSSVQIGPLPIVSLHAWMDRNMADVHQQLPVLFHMGRGELGMMVVEFARLSPDEAMESMTKEKHRRLTTLRFFGALHERSVVSTRIIVDCFHALLPTTQHEPAPTVEAVECACELLVVTGRFLDAQQNGLSPLVNWVLNLLGTLSRRPLLEPRIRYLILNIGALRQSDWKPRRQREEARPLAQIEEEHARKLERGKGRGRGKKHYKNARSRKQ